MKKMIFIVAAFAICLPLLNAQPRSPRNGGEGPEKRMETRRMENLKEILALSDKQVKELEEVYETSRAEKDEAREKFMEENRKITENMNAKIGKILTKEQLEKYTELMKERPADGKGRHHRPGMEGQPPCDGKMDCNRDSLRVHRFCNQ